MKRISCSIGTGSSVASSIGVSVVPTRVWPCHGIANITRLSGVRGTMIALSPGRNEPSRTMCTPWLGEIIGVTDGASRRRTASVNGPVALITQRACTLNSRPDSRSWSCTPLTSPSPSLSSPVART